MICNITGLEFIVNYEFPREFGKPVIIPHLYAKGLQDLKSLCKSLIKTSVKDNDWKIKSLIACRLLFVHSFDEYADMAVGTIRVTENGVLSIENMTSNSIATVLIELDKALTLSGLIHTQEYRVIEINKKHINTHYCGLIKDIKKTDALLDYSPYIDPNKGINLNDLLGCIAHILNMADIKEVEALDRIRDSYRDYSKNPLDLVAIITLDTNIENLGVDNIRKTLKLLSITVMNPITDIDKAIMTFKGQVARALRAYVRRKKITDTQTRSNSEKLPNTLKQTTLKLKVGKK